MAKKLRVCEDCGKRDGIGKYEKRCPDDNCDGLIVEVDARAVKQERAQRSALTAEQQAVVEILVPVAGVTKKDARNAVERMLVTDGRDLAHVRRAADTVAHSKNIERPIGFFITLCKRQPDEGKARVRAANGKSSGWDALENRTPQGRDESETIGDVVRASVPARVGTHADLTAKPKPRRRRKGELSCKDVTGKTMAEWRAQPTWVIPMQAKIAEYAAAHGIKARDLFAPDAKHPPDDEHYIWRIDAVTRRFFWDGPFDCLTCSDIGRVQRRDDNGTPLFESVEGGAPAAVWDRCPSCSPDREAAQLARRIKESGIADAPAWTLDALTVVPGLEPIIDAARRWAAGDFLQLFVSGDTGRGKTHIAIGALRVAIEAGDVGYYLNIARFLDELRSTYDVTNEREFGDLMTLVQDLPVLVLDDLGAERGTAWAVEKVYEMVDARWLRGKRTLTITNYEPDSLDDRVLGRLCHTDRTVVLRVPDSVPNWRLKRPEGALV